MSLNVELSDAENYTDSPVLIDEKTNNAEASVSIITDF